LQAWSVTPLKMLVLSEATNVLHMLWYAAIKWVPHKGFALGNGLVSGIIFLTGPATSTILANHMGPLEQGFAQGTMQAVRSLTGVIGPLLFSQLYVAFPHAHELPFFIGAAVAAASIPVVLYPLKRALARKHRMIPTSHSMMVDSVEEAAGEEDEEDGVS